ncbi:hypothetical protein TH5_09040 [Thalassospira xianhensis MCCC 1A02616]|uniref:Uncharacterized protein n=1 Tax=Thalassospira xianhensis MCCC 1A02616 TaxID=1177929 RepID=A0A367UDD9_9PROT|nr:hypothetical protein TH5_09040 [Thalassospira xianhensis MCCC 1A02616]
MLQAKEHRFPVLAAGQCGENTGTKPQRDKIISVTPVILATEAKNSTVIFLLDRKNEIMLNVTELKRSSEV